MELEAQWASADKAYAKGQQAYIEFGQALAKLTGVTQEQIAARYDMTIDQVSHAKNVGVDKRILEKSRNTRILPKSTYSLYLLTTLDDAGFEELAKPDTTQAKILEYKRRLKGPVNAVASSTTAVQAEPAYRVEMVERPVPVLETPPIYLASPVSSRPNIQQTESTSQEAPKIRPPCPGVEGSGHGNYRWEDGKWQIVYNSADFMQNRPSAVYEMTASEALRVLGIQPLTREVLQVVFRFHASQNHPDRGGSTEQMTRINQANERLQRESH